MPFVSVPKDLTKVKSKVAFNLTKRQILCFGLGALAGVPVYLLTRGSIGNDMAAFLMIALMFPFFAFGIYEKDGMPLEKVLWNFICASFLRQHYRPYRTDNGYAAFTGQAHDGGETRRGKRTGEKRGKKQTDQKQPNISRSGGNRYGGKKLENNGTGSGRTGKNGLNNSRSESNHQGRKEDRSGHKKAERQRNTETSPGKGK